MWKVVYYPTAHLDKYVHVTVFSLEIDLNWIQLFSHLILGIQSKKVNLTS